MKKFIIVFLLLIPSTADARCKRRFVHRNSRCYTQTYSTTVQKLDVKLKSESGTILEFKPEVVEPEVQSPQQIIPVPEIHIPSVPVVEVQPIVVPEPVVEPIVEVEPVVEPEPVAEEDLVPAPAPLFIEF